MPTPTADILATPEEYAAFIAQIELRNVWLSSGSIQSFQDPMAPESVYLEIEDTAAYSLTDGGFVCTHVYQIAARVEDKQAFHIELELKVQFDSELHMSDGLFAIFAAANLPLNTWPYVREFLASSAGRMGWQLITLPALKRGTQSAPSSGSDKPSQNSERKPVKPRRRSSATGGTDSR